MRRKLAFVIGLLAGLAVFGLLRRRRAGTAAPGSAPDSPSGADVLRRKLTESRTGGGASPGQPEPPGAEGPDDELGKARAAVHREAHATLDEMRRAGL